MQKQAAQLAEEETEKMRNQSREEEVRRLKEDAARENSKLTVATYRIQMNKALQGLGASSFWSRLSSNPTKEIFVVGPREAGKSTIV